MFIGIVLKILTYIKMYIKIKIPKITNIKFNTKYIMKDGLTNDIFSIKFNVRYFWYFNFNIHFYISQYL